MNEFKRISVAEARNVLTRAKSLLCDIRDYGDFNDDHDERAVHLTPQTLPIFVSDTPKETPVVVICYHGNSSQSVAQYLVLHGFTEVYSVDGGYEEWLTQIDK